jgi:predicted RNase H-like nuclease
MRALGMHLAPTGEHESAVVEVVGGRALAPALARTDAEVLAALPPPPALVVVDAPLAIPNATGKRDVEAVLAWCDIAAFPVSRKRMDAVHGGARGVTMADALRQRGYEPVETIPDLVLRQLLWEEDHAPGRPAMDLRTYRERWIDARAPSYRRARGPSARADALGAARRLLDQALDAPAEATDDTPAILDATACAYVAWRAITTSATVTLGTAERGRMIIPTDANLAGRITLTVDRLRAEGSVLIPSPGSAE